MTTKTGKPSRGEYEVTTDANKRAHLPRVTTIIDWTIKGDGFGAMSYYGAQLALKWVLSHDTEEGFLELDMDEYEAAYESFKQSDYDPNRKLRRDGARGDSAHKLFHYLCQGIAVLQSSEPPWKVGYIDERYIEAEGLDESEGLAVQVPEPFEAVEYDAGACKAYHELFQHLTAEELLNEVRVHWTEHPIDDCPDAICTHGFAGTLDALLPLHRSMHDMKTNKGDARWSAYPQMAMYGRAALQMGLIDGPIEKQSVIIPRPDGEFDLFDDKFVGDEVVDPLLTLYRLRREWGPR